MLTELVKERLSRLLAENRPRRAQPAALERPVDPFAAVRAVTPGRGRSGSSGVDGPPDFEPSEDGAAPDEDPLGWVPRRSGSPAVGSIDGQAVGVDVLDDWQEPPPRRFNRTHVSVVVVLLVLGLLGAGWSVLRARPVAIASTSVTPIRSGATEAGTSESPEPRVGGSTARPVTSATPETQMLVHVLGAVNRPGVVTLPDRARVQDAIRAAGGLRRDAAPGDLNLAAVLTDGEQVVIGTRQKPAGEVRDGSPTTTTGSTDPGSAAGGVVDLNRATETELEGLPGVGPVTAAKILAWRTEHSRFNRIEELQEVDGIGPKTYAQLAPHVRV